MTICGMYDKPSRFIDHQDFFILKKNIEVYWLSHKIRWFRSGKSKDNFVFIPDTVACLDHRIIHQDIAGTDHFPKSGTGMFRESTNKIVIQSPAGMMGGDYK